MMKKKSSTARLLSAAFLLGSTVCLALYGWKEGTVHPAVEDREDVDREAGAAFATEYAAEDGQVSHENAGAETAEHLPLTGETDCFSYEELPDGTLRITGYDEEKNTQDPYRVVIPSMIDGRRVSTLGRECLGAPYAGDLLELTVPEGVTTIEEGVIENAFNISLIKLPDSVTFIDEKAFWRNESPWPVAIACEDTSCPVGECVS